MIGDPTCWVLVAPHTLITDAFIDDLKAIANRSGSGAARVMFVWMNSTVSLNATFSEPELVDLLGDRFGLEWQERPWSRLAEHDRRACYHCVQRLRSNADFGEPVVGWVLAGYDSEVVHLPVVDGEARRPACRLIRPPMLAVPLNFPGESGTVRIPIVTLWPVDR